MVAEGWKCSRECSSMLNIIGGKHFSLSAHDRAERCDQGGGGCGGGDTVRRAEWLSSLCSAGGLAVSEWLSDWVIDWMMAEEWGAAGSSLKRSVASSLKQTSPRIIRRWLFNKFYLFACWHHRSVSRSIHFSNSEPCLFLLADVVNIGCLWPEAVDLFLYNSFQRSYVFLVCLFSFLSATKTPNPECWVPEWLSELWCQIENWKLCVAWSGTRGIWPVFQGVCDFTAYYGNQ